MRLRSVGGGVLLVLLAVGAIGLLYANYSGKVVQARRVLEARGRTVAEALQAGLRAQTRMGRYRGDRIAAILDELAETMDIVSVEVAQEDGTIVAAAGNPLDSAMRGAPGVVWEEDVLIVRDSFAFTHGRGPPSGRGRGRGRVVERETHAWGSSPYALTVVLDASAALRAQWSALIEFIVGVAAVVLLAMLAAGTLLAVQRQRRLREDLTWSQERAAHHERLSRLGAGLAHETKNPLGLVRGLAQTIADGDATAEESRRNATKIVDEADRIVSQIDGFLNVARAAEPAVENVALDDLFSDVQRLVASEAGEAGVELSIFGRGLVVAADPAMLRRVLLNLLINAFRACARGDKVELEAKRTREGVAVYVRDTGCGIAAADLARVTEPYFTRFERGTGLGLALVSQIVLAHGWRIDIDSVPDEGTTVTLAGLYPVA
ncbi:MAG: sensor histidine kinase [Candidatus Hydrogenedentota bacterium]